MRFEGILSAWNPETGYGAIRPAGGGEEVFVGLAAFPTDGDGPRLDEALSFEIARGRDGRKQAVNLQRVRRANPALRAATGVGHARVRSMQKKRRLALAAGAVVTVMVLLGSAKLWRHDSPSMASTSTSTSVRR